MSINFNKENYSSIDKYDNQMVVNIEKIYDKYNAVGQRREILSKNIYESALAMGANLELLCDVELMIAEIDKKINYFYTTQLPQYISQNITADEEPCRTSYLNFIQYESLKEKMEGLRYQLCGNCADVADWKLNIDYQWSLSDDNRTKKELIDKYTNECNVLVEKIQNGETKIKDYYEFIINTVPKIVMLNQKEGYQHNYEMTELIKLANSVSDKFKEEYGDVYYHNGRLKQHKETTNQGFTFYRNESTSELGNSKTTDIDEKKLLKTIRVNENRQAVYSKMHSSTKNKLILHFVSSVQKQITSVYEMGKKIRENRIVKQKNIGTIDAEYSRREDKNISLSGGGSIAEIKNEHSSKTKDTEIKSGTNTKFGTFNAQVNGDINELSMGGGFSRAAAVANTYNAITKQGHEIKTEANAALFQRKMSASLDAFGPKVIDEKSILNMGIAEKADGKTIFSKSKSFGDTKNVNIDINKELRESCAQIDAANKMGVAFNRAEQDYQEDLLMEPLHGTIDEDMGYEQDELELG